MTRVEPWDFDQAIQSDRDAAADQRAQEKWLIDCSEDRAEKERLYRKALAVKITEIRAGGTAATVAGDLARGDDHVSQLGYERDIADGKLEAAKVSAWRASANRRSTEKFIDWSMRRDLAEGGHPLRAAA